MLLDKRDWNALANCYTTDGVLYRPSDASTAIHGRDNILQSFNDRPPKETCHILANTVFTVISEESRVWLVTGPSSSELPVNANSNLMIGGFSDELRYENGSWYIAVRRGSIELKYDYAN